VLRAYTLEARALVAQAGISGAQVRAMPLFRILIVVQKS